MSGIYEYMYVMCAMYLCVTIMYHGVQHKKLHSMQQRYIFKFPPLRWNGCHPDERDMLFLTNTKDNKLIQDY